MIGQARESLARLGEGNTAAVADEEEGKDGAVGGEKPPAPQCDFVLGARLSGGTKPVLKPSAGPGAGYASSVPRTQLHSTAAAESSQSTPLESSRPNVANSEPSMSIFSTT